MQSVERWRYRCPRDHCGWEVTGRAFWCRECHSRADDRTGSFDRVLDTKTDELLTASELQDRHRDLRL